MSRDDGVAIPEPPGPRADGPPIPLDRAFCDHLAELVLCCDARGQVCYANPAARRWSAGPLEGRPILALIVPEAHPKARRFLEAAMAAGEPTVAWELPLAADAGASSARFRGYTRAGCTVVLAEVDPEQISALQRELLDLNSDLVNAQRAQQRQNRALQEALSQQQALLRTVQELTAPAVSIWPRVLLLPVVGYLDSRRAHRITDHLLQRVSADRVRFAILDVSGIAAIDTAVAQHLIDTSRTLRLLGAVAVLVGVSPEIAQTMVHLGVEMSGFVIQSDVQHALSYVLRHSGGV